MSRVLPILFNTDMVRAILDGRKTVTRRLIKVPPYYPHFYKLHDNTDGALSGTRNRLYAGFYNDEHIFYIDGKKHVDAVYYQAPYKPGDILYVRETWERFDCCSCEGDEHGNCPKEPKKSVLDKYGCGCYMYRASDEIWGDAKWHPSIHMPKEAARIWLKVKDVRVERLQEIAEEQAKEEGAIDNRGFIHSPDNEYDSIHSAKEHFKQIWNSTIKKSDIDRYGWDAPPWVWVIEFERCEKPEN